MEPDKVAGVVHQPSAAHRPRAPIGQGGTGRAGADLDRTDQLTQRIIGVSRSTSYGLLQAHERALREIADCRPGRPGAVPDIEWFQALIRAHSIFVDEASAAYVAAAGGAPDPPDDQATQRIHDLHERIVQGLRASGPGPLDGYATVLRAVVDFTRDTLGADDREWIQVVAGSYARLLDQLTAGPGT